MELQPYYADQPLVPTDIAVRIKSSDRKRIAEIVGRAAKEITVVNDQASFTAARRTAGLLKALADEIYKSKRSAKKPFELILTAIEDLAKELNGPINEEQLRIGKLLNAYVAQLEQKQKEAERLEREKKAAEERAHQEQIAKLEAEGKAEAARLAALQHDLDSEVSAMTLEPVPGLVPGGRVTHPFKFKLLDPAATVRANCIRLLKIDLDVLACQDSCRRQLEIAPDKMPQLPGIEVTRETSVQIKASSRIS